MCDVEWVEIGCEPRPHAGSIILLIPRDGTRPHLLSLIIYSGQLFAPIYVLGANVKPGDRRNR